MEIRMNTEEKEVDSSKTVEKNEAEISVEDTKEVKLEENPKGDHSSKDSVEENIESITARDSEESEDDSSEEKSITNKKIYKELKSLKKEIKRLRKSVKKLKKKKKK